MTDTRNYADSFAILDADGDGRVSASELVGLMRSLGDDVTDEAAAHAVELMDTDGDGQVSLEEFAGYLEHRSAGPVRTGSPTGRRRAAAVDPWRPAAPTQSGQDGGQP